ncbi:hypothetical protein BKA57DRAFT_464176 [Linnemannia elongata]|nr:hypothetical protein BKA57DRAFT_464176 [Linnemannia elongata]
MVYICTLFILLVVITTMMTLSLAKVLPTDLATVQTGIMCACELAGWGPHCGSCTSDEVLIGCQAQQSRACSK